METTHLTQAPYHPDFLPSGVFNPAGNPEQESDWQAWCEAHPWLIEAHTDEGWEAHEVTVPTHDGFRTLALRYATEAEALDAIAEIARLFTRDEMRAVRCREDGTDHATTLLIGYTLAGVS